MPCGQVTAGQVSEPPNSSAAEWWNFVRMISHQVATLQSHSVITLAYILHIYIHNTHIWHDPFDWQTICSQFILRLVSVASFWSDNIRILPCWLDTLDWFKGQIYRTTPYFIGKTMASGRFSLQPERAAELLLPEVEVGSWSGGFGGGI
jgi:hypothetical protein